MEEIEEKNREAEFAGYLNFRRNELLSCIFRQFISSYDET